MPPSSGSCPSAEVEANKTGPAHQLQSSKDEPDLQWLEATDADTSKIAAGALWEKHLRFDSTPYRASLEDFDTEY